MAFRNFMGINDNNNNDNNNVGGFDIVMVFGEYHPELTADEFIDKVARVMAVEQLITAELQNPSAPRLRSRGFMNFMAVEMVTALSELTEELSELKHHIDEHSNDVRATAATNERVAQSLAQYNLFTQRRLAPNAAAAVPMDVDSPENSDSPESSDDDLYGSRSPGMSFQ